MVGKICTVCKSCSLKSKELSFFTYPGDPLRRYKWLEAVERLDLMHKLENTKTRGNHRICEIHFEDKFVRKSSMRSGRKYLTKDAFPTLRLLSPTLTSPTESLLEPPREFSTDRQYYNYVDEKDCKPNHDYRSLSCTDVSEFCESIIKVSKGTQTQQNVVVTDIMKIDDNSVQTTRSEDSVSKQSFLEQCFKFLPDSLTQIIKWHLNSTENQVCVNLHLFALHLHYSSNSYSLLKETMSLPTLDTLKHFLVPKTNKLSDRFLNALKIKVFNMLPKEKVCSFSVGSMYLKPNLYYDIKFDRIIGFHEVNGNQVCVPAKYVIVLMVQGILEDWKQPIAYSFVSEYDNFPEISIWIDEVITLLLDIGLDIRTFVSDPRSEYMYQSNTRAVTVDRTFFTNNNRNIYYVYDAQQLSKVVRNNNESCNFLFNSKLANRDDKIDFYKRLNILTCMLNGKTQSNFKGKYEVEFMEEMCTIFQSLKVIRKADGVDVTENMKFVKDFQITINSVMQLYNTLSLVGIKYLRTSRLSHTHLNSLFTRAKILGTKECTPRQFNKCFTRSMIFNLFKRPSKPCAFDNSSQIEHLLNDDESEGSEDESNQPLKIYTTDYRLSLPEKNAFVFVCGYCYMKCIRRHCCETLKNYLKFFQESQDRDDVPYLCGVKLDNDNYSNCRILPPDNFTEFLMLLEKKFKNYLQSEIQINSIGQDLIKNFGSCEFDMPCPCFPVDYLKMLFIRIRIFYTVRKNNIMFRRKKGAKQFKLYSL